MMDRLMQKISELDAPVVVGLDPQLGFVPGQISSAAFEECGETLEEPERQYGDSIKG